MADRSTARRRRMLNIRIDPTLAVSVAAAVVAALAAITRQHGIPRFRTIWAEDGALFAQCPLLAPSPVTCVLTPYDGWLHLVPRLLGWVAASGPPAVLSYVLTAFAALALAGCAFVVARAVVGACGSTFAGLVAGLVAGAGLALVYPAGAEVAGNITNLAWIMFVASAVIVTCAILGRSMDGLDATFIVLTIASSPFGFLLAALLAIEWLLGRPRSTRPRLLVVSGALATIQLAVGTVSPRNVLPDLPVTLTSPIGWLAKLVFVDGPFGARGPVPGWAIGIATLVVLATLVYVWIRSSRGRGGDIGEVGGAERSVLALLALTVAAAAVFAASTYLNHHVTARYEYIPTAAMVVVLMLGLARLGTFWTRSFVIAGRPINGASIPVALAAVVLAVGFATTFRVTTGASKGPSYPAAFRDAITACGGGATVAVVPISPLPAGAVASTWEIQIPCTRVGG